MNTNTSKKQEGFVLVVVAVVLVALIGFLALAVDVGVLYSARTSAQEVADAAALAGAFTFINEDRKSTRLNSSHVRISYAVFCLRKKHICSLEILNAVLLGSEALALRSPTLSI